MGYNLSKGERFDLSKSSNESTKVDSSNKGSTNTTKSKDITTVILIIITVLVIALNASLWYHVLAPSSNNSQALKKESEY